MDTPSFVTPVPREPRRSYVPLVVIAIALLAVLVVLAALFMKGGGLGDRDARALKVSQGFPTEVLYAFDGELRDIEESVDGVYAGYVATDAGSVAIVHKPTGDELQLLGEEPRLLMPDERMKSGLVASADGSRVAFSVMTGTNAGQLIDWMPHVLTLETNELIGLEQGFGPVFFAHDGIDYVFFTTSEGVAVADLTEGQVQTTFIEHADDLRAATVNADGTLAVIRDTEGVYHVYDILAVFPEFMVKEKAALDPLLLSVVFHNGTLYGIRTSDAGSELVTYDRDFAETSAVALPPADVPYYLLP